ncbi:Rho termination factor N-terminal domain-containing protein, partial [uncultured Flavobacterium sp.]|uniref:Rho termination factor N-terminal domain-containing protein n=1 Tax=uncultured Flavobacterium sp. TaxID=165435 RepID=UPI0030ED112A
MKLSDLHEIAKAAKLKKVSALKKDELIYQILDHQALNPIPVDIVKTEATIEKRAKVTTPKAKKPVVSKTTKPVVETTTKAITTEEKPVEKGPIAKPVAKPKFTKETKIAATQEAINFEENSKPEKKAPQLTEEQRKAIIEKANQNNPNHPSYIGPKVASSETPIKKEIKSAPHKKNNYREPDYEFDGII